MIDTKRAREAAERLEQDTVRVVQRDWQKGLHCPECNSGLPRPKCFYELGGGCPRHDPCNYEGQPVPWVTSVRPDSAAGATTIRELADEVERLRAEVVSAGQAVKFAEQVASEAMEDIDRLRARVAELEAAIPPGFRIESMSDPRGGYLIVRAVQRDGTSLWKVQHGHGVLGKDGRWEWEPQPSSRTDEYLARTRFASVADAAEALRKDMIAKGATNG